MQIFAYRDRALASHQFKSPPYDHPRLEHHEARLLPSLLHDLTASGTRQKAQMFRPLMALSLREVTKWCAYALVLLAPGSFVVLPVLWLVRLLGTKHHDKQ